MQIVISIVSSGGRGFASLLAIYVVGNSASVVMTWYFVGLDVRIAHLMPFVFLVVPCAGVFVSARFGLFKEEYRFRTAVLGLLTLYVCTWLGVLYVYLMNFYPALF